MGNRPVTIFTGQWADLPFETVCRKMSSFGYDGLEIACWGDHMDVRLAAEDHAYAENRKNLLAEHGLGCWALGAHLNGQCVASLYDPRYDGFLPAALKGRGDQMQAWAAEEMKATAQAAQAMGIKVVTGFVGSPVWNYWYSFPQTGRQQVDDAFREVVDKWTPILDVFDRCGVRFALEVHPTEIAFDFYSTEKLLKTFDYRETFGLNFDPSPLLWQGVNPSPEAQYPVFFLALGCGLLLGALGGLLQGILITRGNIAPFIVTLGFMAIYRSSALNPGQGGEFRVDYGMRVFSDFGTGTVLGLPVPSLIFFGLAVVFSLILNWTRFGRYVCKAACQKIRGPLGKNGDAA